MSGETARAYAPLRRRRAASLWQGHRLKRILISRVALPYIEHARRRLQYRMREMEHRIVPPSDNGGMLSSPSGDRCCTLAPDVGRDRPGLSAAATSCR